MNWSQMMSHFVTGKCYITNSLRKKLANIIELIFPHVQKCEYDFLFVKAQSTLFYVVVELLQYIGEKLKQNLAILVAERLPKIRFSGTYIPGINQKMG